MLHGAKPDLRRPTICSLTFDNLHSCSAQNTVTSALERADFYEHLVQVTSQLFNNSVVAYPLHLRY